MRCILNFESNFLCTFRLMRKRCERGEFQEACMPCLCKTTPPHTLGVAHRIDSCPCPTSISPISSILLPLDTGGVQRCQHRKHVPNEPLPLYTTPTVETEAVFQPVVFCATTGTPRYTSTFSFSVFSGGRDRCQRTMLLLLLLLRDLVPDTVHSRPVRSSTG